MERIELNYVYYKSSRKSENYLKLFLNSRSLRAGFDLFPPPLDWGVLTCFLPPLIGGVLTRFLPPLIGGF
jgi:hypothetical protein